MIATYYFRFTRPLFGSYADSYEPDIVILSFAAQVKGTVLDMSCDADEPLFIKGITYEVSPSYCVIELP